MRVITGTAKGRPLKSVKGREVRPTSDRVKETLFNVIGPRILDADFLDLFAGSGAVGVEALSRGAASCIFVELVTAHMRVVEENLAATGVGGRVQVLRRDVRAAFADLNRRGERFDVIFADPPYGQSLATATVEAVAKHGLLRAGGWLVCEHHRKESLIEAVQGPGEAGGLLRFRELTVGETMLSFYAAELLTEMTNPDGRQ